MRPERWMRLFVRNARAGEATEVALLCSATSNKTGKREKIQ
jgi:hypothetical protein